MAGLGSSCPKTPAWIFPLITAIFFFFNSKILKDWWKRLFFQKFFLRLFETGYIVVSLVKIHALLSFGQSFSKLPIVMPAMAKHRYSADSILSQYVSTASWRSVENRVFIRAVQTFLNYAKWKEILCRGDVRNFIWGDQNAWLFI